MRNRGFSLIEILVALVLLGLSLGLAAPSLSHLLRTVELKGAAQKLSAILRNCRSEAIHRVEVYRVLFNPQSRQIRVQGVESTRGGDEEKEASVSERTYVLPEGIQMKGDPSASASSATELPPIEFYPNGGSNGGRIFLASPDRVGYRIDVHFLTGSVTVKRLQ